MSNMEIASLEHAGRSAMVFAPEGFDGDTHVTYLLRAIVPAIGILAVAATLLLAVL